MNKLKLALFGLFISTSLLWGAVTPLVPDNDGELTDISVAFKVTSTTDGPYLIQVSRDADFSGTVLTQEQTEKDSYNQVYFQTRHGNVNASKRFMLEAGTWYWRVTDDAGQSYSEVRSLIVNDERPETAQQRTVSPSQPLFHMRLDFSTLMDANNIDPAVQMAKMVPEHLRPYVVVDPGQSFGKFTKGRSLLEYSRYFNDLGVKFFFDTGRQDVVGRIGSLAEVEQVFKELPNCIGVGTSELFYGYTYNEDVRSQLDGTLELCRKYGKLFSYGDMNWKWAKWPIFNDINYEKFQERNYGAYFLPYYKTTDPWGAYTCVSSLQGMKLCGMVEQIGIWNDVWCWEKFGQPDDFVLADWLNGSGLGGGGEEHYPYIQNIKQMLYGMTYGATAFAVEGNWHWGYLDGEPNDNWYRYIEPFLSAVVQEDLIPSEEAIGRNFKVIVDAETTPAEGGQNYSVPLTFVEGNIWGDFLRSTYGITDLAPYGETATSAGDTIYQSAYLEMIPNTDRYPSGIPFLPKSTVEAPMINGSRLPVVKISELDTEAEVDARLNIYYEASTNEAYAQKIDQTIFVYNTLENHDQAQRYKVGIYHAGIETLSGSIDLMNYVVGRCRNDGESIFFQVNGYVPDANQAGGKYALSARPTELTFRCTQRPTLICDEMDAFVRQEWDEDTGMLELEIDHSVAGAVDFVLENRMQATYVSADSTSFSPLEGEAGWVAGDPNRLSDGSGLSQLVASLSDDTIQAAVHTRGYDPALQNINVDGTLVKGAYDFRFDSPQRISDIYVWNYSQGSAGHALNLRGIGDYEVQLDTGSGYGDVVARGTLSTSSDPHTAQMIDLGMMADQVVGVRIVGKNLSYGSGSNYGLGLDEVVFRSPTLFGYSAFSARYELVGNMDGDDDGDGVINLMEYALKGDPTNALNKGEMPKMDYATSGEVTIRHLSLSDAGGGVTYTVEYTDDLVGGTWFQQWDDIQTNATSDAGYDEVIYSLDSNSHTQRFFRVKVSTP